MRTSDASTTNTPVTTGECYVCFEADAPASPCRCRDRFVHVWCQLKQVEASGKAICGVCTATYPNVECSVTETERIGRRAWCFVAMSVIFCCMITLSGYRWGSGVHEGAEYGGAIEVALMLPALVIPVLVMTMESYFYYKGMWLIIERTRSVKVCLAEPRPAEAAVEMMGC